MKVLHSDLNVEMLLAAAIAAEHNGDKDLAENLLDRAINYRVVNRG
jgi:hypothetical protein